MIENIPPQTVRDRIMTHLAARFKDSQAGVDGRYMTWNTVHDTPLTNVERLLGDAISLYDGRELKKPEIGYERCELEVQTEFKIKLAMGDNPASIARAVLGEVQATMLSDIYCTDGARQLSLNIVEVGNEIDVEGPDDQTVSGIVFWKVQYRHKAGDPRKLVGE